MVPKIVTAKFIFRGIIFVMETENKSKQKENHTKPLRLFKIEQAIQNLGYPSVERLQKELEVSRRTILRDIDELKIYYNAPIEYDRMRKGYYYSDNTYFVKKHDAYGK